MWLLYRLVSFLAHSHDLYWSQIQPYKQMSTCSHPKCHSGQQSPGMNFPWREQWLLLLKKFAFKLARWRTAQDCPAGKSAWTRPSLGAAPPLLHSAGQQCCQWAESRLQARVLLLSKTGKFTQSHRLPQFSHFQCQCQIIKVNCKKTAAGSVEIRT